jgi:CheY-like chemotaxis protein
MLRSLGVAAPVGEACDGDEVAGALAAAAAAGNPFDVVLMDIVMKRMHGTDARRARRLAAASGTGPPAPPVVCVSANTALFQSGTALASAQAEAASGAALAGGYGMGGGGKVGTIEAAAASLRFDALLPKPFTKAALEAVLLQVLPSSTHVGTEVATPGFTEGVRVGSWGSMFTATLDGRGTGTQAIGSGTPAGSIVQARAAAIDHALSIPGLVPADSGTVTADSDGDM